MTDLLAKFGLGNIPGRLPDQLSGGQCQRVAVARAFANAPPLILADEPTGCLDSVETEKAFSTTNAIDLQEQATVVAITHDMDIANHMHCRIHQVGDQVNYGRNQ